MQNIFQNSEKKKQRINMIAMKSWEKRSNIRTIDFFKLKNNENRNSNQRHTEEKTFLGLKTNGPCSGPVAQLFVLKRLQSGHIWEATDGCFSITSMFLSFPSFLSKANERISLDED